MMKVLCAEDQNYVLFSHLCFGFICPVLDFQGQNVALFVLTGSAYFCAQVKK